MRTIVMVHGAWGGSYGFRTVRRKLQADGHEVFTPSLTGIGERTHLASPQITLTTHVQDVVNTILYEDLHDITLVGYSYGGAVVTASLRHIADRVQHLVYLDAFVPDSGQSLLDAIGFPEPPIELGGSAFIEPADRDFDDPDEAAFNAVRRVPQPVGTLSQPVRLDRALEDHDCSLTYIKAAQSPPDDPGETHFRAMGDRARASDRWSYREIDTNHMIPANRPDALVEILESLG